MFCQNLSIPPIRYKNTEPIAASKIQILRLLLSRVPCNLTLTSDNFFGFSNIAEIFNQHPDYVDAHLNSVMKKSSEKFSTNCFWYNYTKHGKVFSRPIAINILCNKKK